MPMDLLAELTADLTILESEQKHVLMLGQARDPIIRIASARRELKLAVELEALRRLIARKERQAQKLANAA